MLNHAFNALDQEIQLGRLALERNGKDTGLLWSTARNNIPVGVFPGFLSEPNWESQYVYWDWSDQFDWSSAPHRSGSGRKREKAKESLAAVPKAFLVCHLLSEQIGLLVHRDCNLFHFYFQREIDFDTGLLNMTFKWGTGTGSHSANIWSTLWRCKLIYPKLSRLKPALLNTRDFRISINEEK